MKNLFAVLAVAGLAAAANAQGTGTWTLLDGSGTSDGDFIIDEAKGESSVTYKFGMDLDPGPGGTLGDGSTVIGFGSVIANFIGTSNWASGNVTWTMNPDLIFLTGDLTTKDDATQDLSDVNAGQIPGFGPFSSADPIWIITVEWSTTDFSTRDVTATADTQDGDTIQAYIKKPGAAFEEPQTWAAADGSLSHSVVPVPAPATAGLLGLGALVAGRRRR